MAIEIVDFPIKNGDFPWQNVSSPEGSRGEFLAKHGDDFLPSLGSRGQETICCCYQWLHRGTGVKLTSQSLGI